jgi:putative phosphoesterase
MLAICYKRLMRIGVISDTHGLLRDEAIDALRGSELILHAGDVGTAPVLDALREIAPVVAVRGNVDYEDDVARLPECEIVSVEQCRLYVLHDLAQLDIDPAAAGYSAVIYGHSHIPKIEHRHGVLFLNPGSAGPRRFKLPITLAHLTVTGTQLDAQLVHLR